MNKNMKSVMKKVVVKCLDWEDVIDIDSVIFDDVYMEAATRALEKRKDGEKFLVTVVMECYLKRDINKPDKHFVYNTYFVLVNAGLHQKAEVMRFNFLKSHGIDLRKEKIKGEENGPNDPKSQSNSSKPNKSVESTKPTEPSAGSESSGSATNSSN
jgi:hypothetical protein